MARKLNIKGVTPMANQIWLGGMMSAHLDIGTSWHYGA
jgi:hypothetical protein